jgi:capsular polysaccharide biosynthesis protein
VVIVEKSEFAAIRCADFPEIKSLRAFQTSSLANLAIEPAGRMIMPSSHVTNKLGMDYRLHQTMFMPADGRLPAATHFPKMMITILKDAYCLPFGPPFLPNFKQIITDYLVPWAPEALGWFSHIGGDIYTANVSINTDDTEYDLDTAFYMDHSISGHYGHFIGDCLPRLHAWDICQALFGEMKIIVADSAQIDFQTHLLNAAGVASRDIVRIKGLVRCRRLLLATQSFGVEHYASPTSAKLWAAIRDRSSIRDITLPSRIYLSRKGVKTRRLDNESDVERVFERHGFTIIRPETLRVEKQIALMANALLVAGPSGSGLFNLAFQGRMRSGFVLVWDGYIHMSEMLFSAGRGSDLWYHIGQSVPPDTPGATRDNWAVDLARLESEVADWLAQTGLPSQ